MMIDPNVMAMVDGRRRPTLEQVQKHAIEMHTLLRATLNILNSTCVARFASEAMLLRIIEETLKKIDESSTLPAENMVR